MSFQRGEVPLISLKEKNQDILLLQKWNFWMTFCLDDETKISKYEDPNTEIIKVSRFITLKQCVEQCLNSPQFSLLNDQGDYYRNVIIDSEKSEKNQNRLMSISIFKEGQYPDHEQGVFPDKDLIYFVFLMEKNNDKILHIMKNFVMKLVCYDMKETESLFDGIKLEVKLPNPIKKTGKNPSSNQITFRVEVFLTTNTKKVGTEKILNIIEQFASMLSVIKNQDKCFEKGQCKINVMNQVSYGESFNWETNFYQRIKQLQQEVNHKKEFDSKDETTKNDIIKLQAKIDRLERQNEEKKKSELKARLDKLKKDSQDILKDINEEIYPQDSPEIIKQKEYLDDIEDEIKDLEEFLQRIPCQTFLHFYSEYIKDIERLNNKYSL